jgi:dTDP-4-dehydrorhamnose reductase
MTTVLVLGTTGMLGSIVYDFLRKDKSLRVSGTARDGAKSGGSAASMRALDAEGDGAIDLAGVNWVVNCIGVIKPYIHDDNRDEVVRAIRVNSMFPIRLAVAAERSGTRVIQIATDCVYSGRDGNYDERAAHDPTDVYGKTKSMGEVNSPNVNHLRCSIIGPEVKGFVSLLSWFLKQDANATLNGYRNHQWNGVTTLHFAKICGGIIKEAPKLPHVQHVIPSGDITKADLLRSFAREYDRKTVTIKDVDAPSVIDRRLRTTNAEVNAALWKAAGHAQPPTVEAMVHELAVYRSGL